MPAIRCTRPQQQMKYSSLFSYREPKLNQTGFFEASLYNLMSGTSRSLLVLPPSVILVLMSVVDCTHQDRAAFHFGAVTGAVLMENSKTLEIHPSPLGLRATYPKRMPVQQWGLSKVIVIGGKGETCLCLD